MFLTISIISATIVFVCIISLISSYKKLIAKKQQLENAFSGIEIVLKKRYDLIPNLVQLIQAEMTNESAMFTDVSSLLAKTIALSCAATEKIPLENQLSRILRHMIVAAENYPVLKENPQFSLLQRTLNEVEEQIYATYRTYNAIATEYNSSLKKFPASVFALLFKYCPQTVFAAFEMDRRHFDIKPKKSREEFDLFYKSELVPRLEKLEQQRKTLAQKIIKAIALAFVKGIVLFAIMYAVSDMFFDKEYIEVEVMISFGFAAFSYLSSGVDEDITAFTVAFKHHIIENLVKFFDSSLSYFPDKKITQQEFSESQLFLYSNFDYFGDDLVIGKLDKTAIKFSEVRAKTLGKKSHSIFKGIFFIADFNKNFNGKTILFSKRYGFHQSRPQKYSLLTFENADFENLFRVHSTNQIEARYILSDNLMQKIIALQQKSPAVCVSFVNSKVFIAMPITKYELFEPSYFKTLLNPNLLRRYFNYLSLAIGIVEELDLNTRIWTKD